MQGADGPQTRPAMTVQESVKQCLWKYADFSGRATRAEFWWWVLLATIGPIVFYGVAGSIYALARIHRRYDVAAAEWVMRGKGRRWSGHDSSKWGRVSVFSRRGLSMYTAFPANLSEMKLPSR